MLGERRRQVGLPPVVIPPERAEVGEAEAVAVEAEGCEREAVGMVEPRPVVGPLRMLLLLLLRVEAAACPPPELVVVHPQPLGRRHDLLLQP